MIAEKRFPFSLVCVAKIAKKRKTTVGKQKNTPKAFHFWGLF